MEDPLEITLRELIEQIRDKKCVPLGMLCCNVEREALQILLLQGVDPYEVNALLHKLGVRGYQV